MNRVTLAVALSTLVLAAPLRSADEITSLDLPAENGGAAVHPDTGALAVALPSKDLLVVYPKAGAADLAGAKEIDCPTAGGVVFKRVGAKDYWCAISVGGLALHVYDAKTLELVKKIKLDLGAPRSLVASRNPKDRYVYYCGGQGHDCRFNAVDLVAFADLGAVKKDSATRVAISGDGAVAYPLGPWSPTGFSAGMIEKPETENGPPTFRQVFSEHTSVAGYVPDADGQFTVVGTIVYSPKLDKKLGTLGGPGQWVSPTRPLIAGVVVPDPFRNPNAVGRKLTVWSANTFKQLASVELPKAKAAGDQRFPQIPGQGPPTVFAEDPVSKSLMLVSGSEVLVVPANVLDLPKEANLSLRFDGPDEGAVGKPLKIKVVASTKDAKLVLSGGPTGLTLDGDTIAWTPSGEDVGTHRVAIKASAGDADRLSEISLRVSRPSVEVPFRVADFAVSADGRWALAFGSKTGAVAAKNDLPPGFAPRGANPEAKAVALIDLDALKIVAQRDLPAGVKSAAIDGHFAYVATADSDAVLVLDKTALADKRKLFSNGPVSGLVATGGHLWIASAGEPTTVITVPALTQAGPEAAGLALHMRGNGRAQGLPTPMADGWLINGVVHGPDLAVKAVVAPTGLLFNGQSLTLRSGASSLVNGFDGPRGFPGQVETEPRAWGVQFSNGQLLAGKRVLIRTAGFDANGGVEAMAVLSDKPAAVKLRATSTFTQAGARTKAELQFHDLETGAVVERQILSDGPTAQPVDRFGASGTTIGLAARPGRVVARSGARLFVISTADLDAKKYPEPFHAAGPGPVTVVKDAEAVIKLPTPTGGTKPVEFTLARDVPGVRLDKDGTLRVETEALVKHLAGLPKTFPFDESARAEAVKTFERLTGSKTSGVPVWVAPGVTARDADLREASIASGFFVELPASAFDRPVAGGGPPIGEISGGPPVKAPPPLDATNMSATERALLQRIRDLEAKVERLERAAPRGPR